MEDEKKSRKKADRQALLEFANSVKRNKNLTSLGLSNTVSSPRNKTPIDFSYSKVQDSQLNTLNTIVEQEVDNERSPVLPSTLVESGVYFKADSEKHPSNFGNTLPMPRQKVYSNTGLHSRTSPRSGGRYQANNTSPSTLSDLRFVPGRTAEVSNFSQVCQSVHGVGKNFGRRQSKDTPLDSMSPCSMVKLGRSEARIGEDYMTVQGYGSPTLDHYTTLNMRLLEENEQLRQSNEAYKREISLLAHRVETLAAKIEEQEDRDGDECTCYCEKHSRDAEELKALRAKVFSFETAARKINSQQSWTDLKDGLSLADEREKSKEKLDDIATSRLTNRTKEIERAKAKIEQEYSTISVKYEAALKEIATFKNSKLRLQRNREVNSSGTDF